MSGEGGAGGCRRGERRSEMGERVAGEGRDRVEWGERGESSRGVGRKRWGEEGRIRRRAERGGGR